MTFAVIKPPSPFAVRPSDQPAVFLGGTIDMGKSVDWQTDLTQRLSGRDITILNPRRDSWDSDWEQDISNPMFREQVEWELGAMEVADLVVFYFAPGSQSPVTMMELGLYAKSDKVIVCCPKGFWRRGNIQITSRRYGFPMVESLTSLASEIEKRTS